MPDALPPCPGFFSTVQPGDTLLLIAQRFGVSLSALIAANPQIPNPNLIFPGQPICIPLPVPVPEPPLVQHLRSFIGQNIRVVLIGGQASALVELTGTLRDVFSDHILLLVDTVPHHIRIAAIAFFVPLPGA